MKTFVQTEESDNIFASIVVESHNIRVEITPLTSVELIFVNNKVATKL